MLNRRAETYGPGAVALSSLAVLVLTYISFDHALPWKDMIATTPA